MFNGWGLPRGEECDSLVNYFGVCGTFCGLDCASILEPEPQPEPEPECDPTPGDDPSWTSHFGPCCTYGSGADRNVGACVYDGACEPCAATCAAECGRKAPTPEPEPEPQPEAEPGRARTGAPLPARMVPPAQEETSYVLVVAACLWVLTVVAICAAVTNMRKKRVAATSTNDDHADKDIGLLGDSQTTSNPVGLALAGDDDV